MAKNNLSFSWEKLDLGKNIPAKRACHAMSYAGGSKIVLFGGYDDNKKIDNEIIKPLFNDTWEYDSKSRSWEKIEIKGNVPKARNFHTMSYAGGSKVILFGGSNNDDYRWFMDNNNIIILKEETTKNNKLELGDTWEYDASIQKWTQFNTSGIAPSARSNAVMTYAGGSKIILFGGSGSSDNDKNPILLDETWEYDASTHVWTQHKTKTSPSARFDHTMAYAGGSKILLAGGTNNIKGGPGLNGHIGYDINFFNDLWEFDLNTLEWIKLNDLKKSSVFYFTMAYAGDSKVILLYSELGIRETWEYNTITHSWFKYIEKTKKPSDRDQHAMSYAGESKVIIFGGTYHRYYNPYYNDTWELNIENDL